MKRQGWQERGPHHWTHEAAAITITTDIHYADQATTVIYLSTCEVEQLAHTLRDAWRANKWAEFLKSRSKPARQLSTETWSNIKSRYDIVRRLLDKEQILAPHILAIATGKWVSQGRFDHTRGLPVRPCLYCGHAWPDREHEWICPVLRTSNIQIPVDTLFQQLGWPRQNCASDIILLKELAAIRQRTLADRYPTEA